MIKQLPYHDIDYNFNIFLKSGPKKSSHTCVYFFLHQTSLCCCYENGPTPYLTEHLLQGTADIYTVIRRDVPKHGFSVVQANTHRLTGQSKRESMFWNVSTNYCIYISCDWNVLRNGYDSFRSGYNSRYLYNVAGAIVLCLRSLNQIDSFM